MDGIAVIKRLGTILLVLGPATTLAISPFSSLDPINLIKVLLVSSLSFSALSLVVFSWKSLQARLPKSLLYISISFVAWMTVVLFVSGAPVGQQFWGVFGRNNGYLNYFSLVVVAIVASLIQDKIFYHKLVESLVLTAIPMTAYALVQLFGRDPISWSQMAPFATLGNINFSSAFFGLASICATVLAFVPNQRSFLRLLLIVMVIIDLYIILETESIQGFMIYAAGMGIVGFFVLRSWKPILILQALYVALGLVTFALTALALNNIGPFARFVFGESILFRFDYWYAGWAMTTQHPLFGVGLDSYGDWYRELRGEIATLRTVPDRITNTAHNIYLDISASGGFPLVLLYLILLGFAARAALKVILREKKFNYYFVALFASWVAYLIQAAISINQIGVGIWGWLFTGGLIGYEVATRDDHSNVSQKKTLRNPSHLSASTALVGIAGFVIGFVLAVVPFSADSRFKEAAQTGNPRDQFTYSKAFGATAFHMELALDAAIKANDEGLASEVTKELLRRYPRDFMAWRVKQVLSSSTAQERAEALKRLRELDPYNPEIRPAE